MKSLMKNKIKNEFKEKDQLNPQNKVILILTIIHHPVAPRSSPPAWTTVKSQTTSLLTVTEHTRLARLSNLGSQQEIRPKRVIRATINQVEQNRIYHQRVRFINHNKNHSKPPPTNRNSRKLQLNVLRTKILMIWKCE